MKKTEEFDRWERAVVFPFIRQRFEYASSACLIYHMIEQYEDIYTYLIDGEEIIKIEISRVDGGITIDNVKSVLEYMKETKKRNFQEYLKELLELSNRDDCQL
ncbi:hypothetical protein HV213_18050 [Klebsiella sp. RHBSTW-00484]|uniref:hypothetical protein n=1 Tax=unclassified Klebsiella TaxID=2608929 RepID=UPI0015E57064|nr:MULTISPECIES: hypothetical protein [unclassified Klebsiella]MBA7846522.1 hypothetical protein [Klebsiella sp. RHBSTW-00465]QLO37592.1 hypothetical protein HV213_18050 [Klebsiella sp. RHBSTW-00484]QLT77110.1 hypothetical protein HV204_18050 [Klebsiella sp. RHBSTW-00464]